MSSLRRRLTDGSTARARAEADGGFALVMSVLLILVVGGLSLAALALVVQQTKPTQVVRKNTETINGANAGLQAALTLLRNANVPDSSVGVLAKLPCQVDPSKADAGVPLVGVLQDSTARNGYTTYIRYYASDPTGKDATWLKGNRMAACPLTTVPAFALLENDGTSTSQPLNQANRRFTATYKFTSTNEKPVGGRMMGTRGTNVPTGCWDVGTNPAVGSNLTFEACGPIGTPSQSFRFRKDMTIAWSSPTTTLCLDYRGYWTSTVPAQRGAAPVRITLQECLTSGQFGSAYDPTIKAFTPSAARDQQFAYDGTWFPVEPDGGPGGDRWGNHARTGARASCVGSTTDTSAPGSILTMTASNVAPCIGSSWDASVGAGAAEGTETGLPGPTKQLVNFAVGWCMDVQGSGVGDTSNVYTFSCHQAPDPAKVQANQKFSFSEGVGQPGRVGSLGHCLTAQPPANNLRMQVCGGPESANGRQDWTFSGPVPGDYARSYTISNADGRCLQAARSSVTLVPCTGRENQKWNAPPNLTKASLTGVAETTALR